MTKLGGGIDELNLNLLGGRALGLSEEGLSENERALLDTDNTTLDHEEVLVDDTVVRETTHGGDVLLNTVSLASGVVLNTSHGTSTDSVDLLVDLSSVMVTILTSSSDRPLDGSGMPGTDTGDLAETSMRLTVETGHAESLDHTAVTLTAGDTDGVDALGHLEDVTDLDLAGELASAEVDLVSDGATVDLDLEDVGLVLAELQLADLGGAKGADDGGVLLNALKIALGGVLAVLVLVLAVDVLAEGLLLGLSPVLVESALDIVVEIWVEHGGEGAETTWGLHVSNESNDLHWGSLNDGGGVDDILLDGLLTFTTLLILDDVSHAGLVAHEGSEVDGLALVVPWEGSNAAARVARAPLGQVGEGAAPGVLELTVRHTVISALI